MVNFNFNGSCSEFYKQNPKFECVLVDRGQYKEIYITNGDIMINITTIVNKVIELKSFSCVTENQNVIGNIYKQISQMLNYDLLYFCIKRSPNDKVSIAELWEFILDAFKNYKRYKIKDRSLNLYLNQMEHDLFMEFLNGLKISFSIV